MKVVTLAAQVFKTCKARAKCQEGTLQDASGMDLVEDGTELSASIYIKFFTPAKSSGKSTLSLVQLCAAALLGLGRLTGRVWYTSC